jgi:23S rRNA (pseudouridine1915-N3)-methyltransferase
MNQVEFLVPGRQKFKELAVLEKKYLQRIEFYVKFTLKNVREQKSADDQLLRKREGEQMLQALARQDYVVGLDASGRMLDSEGFAAFLSGCMSRVSGKLVFVMGGRAGLADDIRKRADDLLSFSPMTFPHDLFRVMFLEQLYRALSIVKGHAYHR